MKSTIVVLLVVFSVNLAGTVTVETWGNIYNVRALDFETATARRIFLRVRTCIITFPLVMQTYLRNKIKSLNQTFSNRRRATTMIQ